MCLVIGVWAAVVFLAAFALYDYIAVYKTRHMIGLASIAFNEKLPMLFVFPSQKGVKLDSIRFNENDTHDNKALLLVFKNEWYVVDTAGFFMAAGGSIRDDEVIAKSEELKVPMYFTGKRVFQRDKG